MKETHISVEVFKKAYLVAIQPVATPTIMSYNASAVKNYNATSSLVRFGNKTFSSTLKIALAYYNASAVKNYNATSSVVRFENTIIFFYFEKTL
jgi:hypothetical protein